jgi:hypothetical protein
MFGLALGLLGQSLAFGHRPQPHDVGGRTDGPQHHLHRRQRTIRGIDGRALPHIPARRIPTLDNLRHRKRPVRQPIQAKRLVRHQFLTDQFLSGEPQQIECRGVGPRHAQIVEWADDRQHG